jgi:hypothetical protein
MLIMATVPEEEATPKTAGQKSPKRTKSSTSNASAASKKRKQSGKRKRNLGQSTKAPSIQAEEPEYQAHELFDMV